MFILISLVAINFPEILKLIENLPHPPRENYFNKQKRMQTPIKDSFKIAS